MNIRLQRLSQTDQCTMGLLSFGDTTLQTLELPWIFNPNYPGGEPNKSCVPKGIYDLALHNTVKHPKSFALVNPTLGVIHEPDPDFPNARTACLLHVANTPKDLEGCIGLGLSGHDCYISSSVLACKEFYGAVPWVQGNILEIV